MAGAESKAGKEKGRMECVGGAMVGAGTGNANEAVSQRVPQASGPADSLSVARAEQRRQQIAAPWERPHAMAALMELIEGPLEGRWEVRERALAPTQEFLACARCVVRNAAWSLFDLLTTDDLALLGRITYGEMVCSIMALMQLLEIDVHLADTLMQMKRNSPNVTV